jgi:hypothetical protein
MRLRTRSDGVTDAHSDSSGVVRCCTSVLYRRPCIAAATITLLGSDLLVFARWGKQVGPAGLCNPAYAVEPLAALFTLVAGAEPNYRSYGRHRSWCKGLPPSCSIRQ